MNDKSIFLKCDCHGEAVEFQYESEYNEYYLAFWGCGFGNNKKHGLLRRIKFAWMLLTKGTLYTDMVVLDEEKARQLADFINETQKS
jgi:hypothetical protein